MEEILHFNLYAMQGHPRNSKMHATEFRRLIMLHLKN